MLSWKTKKCCSGSLNKQPSLRGAADNERARSLMGCACFKKQLSALSAKKKQFRFRCL